MLISELFIENVKSSPSGSVAVTVPIAVWFSSTLKMSSDVNTGAASFTSIISIVMSLETDISPSDKDREIEYDDFVSKSGASLNVRTLSFDKLKNWLSTPLNVSVNSSSSTSDTDTVVTAVSPSFTCIIEAISIDGASLTGSIVTTTLLLEALSPWTNA